MLNNSKKNKKKRKIKTFPKFSNELFSQTFLRGYSHRHFVFNEEFFEQLWTNLMEGAKMLLFKMYEKLTIDFTRHATTTIIFTSIPTTWFISCTCHCFIFCPSIRKNWVTPCKRNTFNFNFLEYIWWKSVFLNMSPSCCIAILVFSYRIIIIRKAYTCFVFMAHVNWFQKLVSVLKKKQFLIL